MTRTIRNAAGMAGLAAILFCSTAQAITVGQIQITSGLGDSFKARIPITLAAGEDISAGCVRLDDTAPTKYRDVPALKGYTMTLERSGNTATVTLFTPMAVNEPAVRINLRITCGAKVSTTREFLVTQSLQGAEKK